MKKGLMVVLLAVATSMAAGGDTLLWSSYVNNLADGDTLFASRHWQPLIDTLQAVVNGRLGNVNMAADADIAPSKIDSAGTLYMRRVTSDSLRGNPDVDSLGGNPFIDTVTTRQINPDKIRGAPDVDSLGGAIRFTGATLTVDGVVDVDTIQQDTLTVTGILEVDTLAGTLVSTGASLRVDGKVIGDTLEGTTITTSAAARVTTNLTVVGLVDVDTVSQDTLTVTGMLEIDTIVGTVTTTGDVGVGTLNSTGYSLLVQDADYKDAQFGSTFPVYLLHSYPFIGLNTGEGSTYGPGSTSHYAGAFSFAANTGELSYGVTASPGAAGAAATRTTALTVGRGGLVTVADSLTVTGILTCDTLGGSIYAKKLAADTINVSIFGTGAYTQDTISGDTLTFKSSHMMVWPQGPGDIDTIATIVGGSDGNILIVRSTNNDISINSNGIGGAAGSVLLAGDADFDFGGSYANVMLMRMGTYWVELSRSAMTY